MKLRNYPRKNARSTYRIGARARAVLIYGLLPTAAFAVFWAVQIFCTAPSESLRVYPLWVDGMHAVCGTLAVVTGGAVTADLMEKNGEFSGK